ncbi:DUF5681 domain-containing protein [Burkholderia pseudomallei]|uniref:DUF5681 domain-containing protein n=1 Tax=Burkholderia pseudomallei TaxID=28450 RepID=UPI00052A958E|nr:DUF5681 domain-containing protein [Burkholderia pseudomallei]AIV48547.1 hypothetical protein X988_2244 [Burkholderia pseudomallei TSV 48]KGS63031.1 hypothetical protein X990_1292 [Burkholderia pseudomallei MSHR4868]KGW21881.1 hypothetical protein Y602_904 [Burkholderia pseudomallei MSHR733]RAQ86190.1 hypothetical protein A4G85_13950 [Burkholderia pseudomallei]
MTFRKGASGNPHGRPPSLPKLGREVEKAVSRHAGTLVNVAIRNALAGDAAALAGLLNIVAACIAHREPKPAKRAEAPATD